MITLRSHYFVTQRALAIIAWRYCMSNQMQTWHESPRVLFNMQHIHTSTSTLKSHSNANTNHATNYEGDVL